MELFTLRNFFVVTKKFLKAKFDCTLYSVQHLQFYNTEYFLLETIMRGSDYEFPMANENIPIHQYTLPFEHTFMNTVQADTIRIGFTWYFVELCG